MARVKTQFSPASHEATLTLAAVSVQSHISPICLIYHQHRGKQPVSTFILNNIVERPISVIFSGFVFNNFQAFSVIF